MKKNPKISIVTPAYNSEEYIEQCILSIKNQDYRNYEHIIIDGCSNDRTLDIIRKYEGTYPMRWISEPDEGMYDAINKGFRLAEGEIFAWLNSDDFYFPWTLDVVSRAFEKRKIDWLIGMPCNVKKMDGEEVVYQLPNLPAVFCSSMIRKGVYDGRQMYFIQQESCFWTSALWKKTGGIDKRYKIAGDYFLWKKFSKETDLYSVHCNLASFRIHADQKSGDRDAYYCEVNRKEKTKFEKILTQIYLQLYALKNYRKYMINLDEIFE